MEFEFLIDSEKHRIFLEKKGHGFLVSYDGKTYEADIHQISSNCISILTGNSSKIVYFAKDKDKLYLSVDGHQCTVCPPSDEENHTTEGARSQEDELFVKLLFQSFFHVIGHANDPPLFVSLPAQSSAPCFPSSASPR